MDLGRQEGCHMAYYKAYPDSAVDSAASQLLMGSVPEHWQDIIATKETANLAFDYVLEKFTGGVNQEANLAWHKELTEGMLPNETLEQYATRFQQLLRCLQGNGAIVQEYQVITHLINGLPPEMEPVRMTSHGHMVGKFIDKILPALRHLAHAVGFVGFLI